ncbi:unnamed protein product [Didymodactylos carnosus]|uniref:NYN domain-containing protein n=1 Tax=Didymodactylos carnosus TaxID=1234261 RepID=A0A814M4Q8_9BILA|nr:unnamed protein product [Didymodactylos carnosus]CAF1292123.1 unnamed protein product [Didymodactylos carnosus]CAF3841229.1 unnamed protein product [Didymodactylos carnosus]CAF4096907.1 unnamed protein product [Didymodactylos carnosus]
MICENSKFADNLSLVCRVRIVRVPHRKLDAVDRYILLDLDRFERVYKPSATFVLISGNIDFVGKLSDLRHQAGYNVIVVHNLPAKAELKTTVNLHYGWSTFTKPHIHQTLQNRQPTAPIEYDLSQLPRSQINQEYLNNPFAYPFPANIVVPPVRSNSGQGARMI